VRSGRKRERVVRIKITDETSQLAGFISWYRLATSLFPDGGEIKPTEKVTHFEVSERGINFFVASVKPVRS
jgi:hypothetical protein